MFCRALAATHNLNVRKFTIMKNQCVIKTIGLGSGVALAIGLSISAFAGPGPQYWTQMEQIRAENAAKAKAATTAEVPAAKPADTPAMACAHCKTTPITEYRPSDFGPRVLGHFERVGTKHSCKGCTGSITSVGGKLTDEMKRSCPICTKTGPTCCRVST